MDNKNRTITSFISSKNRQTQENVYDFTIDYPDNILLCRQNEYMELNILSFDMANTMYNINGNNNSFEIITNGTAVSLNIPAGNYNIKNFGNKMYYQKQDLQVATLRLEITPVHILDHASLTRC